MKKKNLTIMLAGAMAAGMSAGSSRRGCKW